MKTNGKLLLEKERHADKVKELEAALEMEDRLYKKNMDKLKDEAAKERLARKDLSFLQPFPFDDSLKLQEDEIEKINLQLAEMVEKSKAMKKRGMDRTGCVESFGALDPTRSQLEMLVGHSQIITPDYNQEEINNGKKR